MKKLLRSNPYHLMRGFFLALLLITGLGGVNCAWANQTSLITDATLPDVPTATFDFENPPTGYTADANNWIVFNPKTKEAATNNWWTATATNYASDNWNVPNNATAPFVGNPSPNSKIDLYTTRAGASPRSHAFRFTNAIKLAILAAKNTNISLFSISNGVQTLIETKTNSSGTIEYLFDNLSVSTEYVVYAYSSQDSNIRFFEVALKGDDADAAPTVSIPAQLNAFTGESAYISATIKSKPAATSIKWYSCNADKSGASVKQDDVNKTSFGFKPASAGTRYYYCEVTNSVGTTESEVCEVTVVDRPAEYTFGLTRGLNDNYDPNTAGDKTTNYYSGADWDAVTGTYPDGAIVTRSNGYTMTGGSQALYHGGSTAYYFLSAANHRYKSGSDNIGVKTEEDAFEHDMYAGFTVTVPDGFEMNIKNIASDIYMSNKTSGYKLTVYSESGTKLWESTAVTGNPSNDAFVPTQNINTESVANLQKLSGTVSVRLYFWLDSSSAYMALKDFNITASFREIPTILNASATMTCGANKYGTFVAPFDVELPGDVVAYSAAVNGDKVSLTKIAEAGETIEAGTPVIIKSVNGLAATTFYGDATVSENPTEGCLVGLLTDLTVPKGAYVLQTQDGVQAFYKLGQNATGAVNRCYVTINSLNAKFAISIADEEATAADVVEAETVKVMPVKFFKNNQIVIMKNGKQYNAAGAEK